MWLTTERGTTFALHDLGGVGPATGPAVLVCHATGFCGQAYAPLARLLGARAHVWALDFPAHGETAPPADGRFDWHAWTAELAAAVEAVAKLAGGPVHAVGHSMGGAIALQAAADRPGLLASAYVYEPIVPAARFDGEGTMLAIGARRRRSAFPSREAALWRYASRPPLGDLTAETLAAYVRHGFADQPDGTVALRCLPENEARTFDASGAITALTVAGADLPVLVAVGGVAPGEPPASYGPRLVAALPQAALRRYDHLGHFGLFQAPATIAADILAHLDLPGRRRKMPA
jgi:pimeloyl-ACP methyl ester carboxylesterase